MGNVLSSGRAQAQNPPSATVLSIGDGDTIHVQQGQQRITVRLGTIVTLKPKTVDRYGRTVAEVIGEINLGLAMVEDGQAFACRKYLAQCDAREYLEAENRTSRRRYGVWQASDCITRPWDFRCGRTSARSGGSTGSGPGGRVYRCSEIGSTQQAPVRLSQGHGHLDSSW